MKIYDVTKTKVLDNPDLKQGWLKRDRIITKTIPAVEEIQEQSHYETVKQYFDAEGNLRGERVKRVVDVEHQAAKPETYEYEDIYVYVLYTEKELLENELESINEWFIWYDKQVAQYGRCLRKGLLFNKDIDELDNEANVKQIRHKEIEQKLKILNNSI